MLWTLDDHNHTTDAPFIHSLTHFEQVKEVFVPVILVYVR